MILDSFLLMTLLLVAAFGLTALTLSPVFIELKKPVDNGPRKIPRTSMERRIKNVGRKSSVVRLNRDEHPNSLDMQNALNNEAVQNIIVGSDTLHIFGNHTFPPHSVISVDVVVEGCLKIGDDCVFNRSVKVGDGALIGNRVTIKENLVSEEDVTILDDVVIGGSVHSEGSVTIGERVFVALSVVAVGDVEVGKNAEIVGGIFTRGVVKGPTQATVELPSSIDEIG